MRFATLSVCAILFAGAGGLAHAADPDAQAVLDDAVNYIQSLDRFQVSGAVTYEVQDPEETQSGQIEVMAARNRPDGFRLDIAEEGFERKTYRSGDKLVNFVKAFNQYTEEPSSGDEAEIVSQLGSGPLGDTFTLFAELFREEPFEAIGGEPAYAGNEMMNGVDTHHIKVTGGDIDFDIFIEKGDSPRIQAISPDHSDFAEAQGVEGLSFETALILNDWSTGTKVAKSTFEFEPPEGAEKVPFFFPPDQRPAPLQLLGKPAPNFELDLLEGGTMELAKEKGNVVILDFWATWCGPCRMLMPIIERVADKFHDKGVRLYAVNLQETPDAIRNFLESNDLDVAVPIDKTGEVSDKYYAHSIPQTVIVGEDGTVQVVHIGFSTGIEEQLTKELEALIAGKKLAG